ncbi:endonuclease/exonuclease/phosphatase family protein [Alteromonas sp. ASW11-130]|uniref:endonuclease/exonuclease/phosphatase family protein n=1 Tax=Alteromonas sp. ASW11-130 TaxID=3015775 RepID=UPI0022422B94|nr:endonuclease/exonuclease/phosphatase family protein [Alteromonas sp. ASW11-130]MCW8091495.1 endonuclease/exonuclease/phosphatase family protein [Alteromonas sp. ASW11-130]
MVTAILIFTLIVVVATLLPLWRNPHWFVRGMDFPRLQLAAIACLLFILQLIFFDLSDPLYLTSAALTIGCLGWQLKWILPYSPLFPVEVKSAQTNAANVTLKILTSNVLTPNKNADALLELVTEYEPDILVTLESDKWWQDKLDAVETEMPHTIKCPLDNLYGMHVYSRLPLEEVETSYLVEDDIPSMHALLVMDNGARVRVHFLHPAPPSPTENPESAERDAELIVVAKSVVKDDSPIIVTGDLNDVAWSATTQMFRKISGLLDPRIGRGMFNTFHADYPFLRWPLDHLFHSSHFTIKQIKRLPSIGSDHFPLFSELVFTPEMKKQQSGEAPSQEERKEAEEVTDEKEVKVKDVPTPGK